MIGGRRAISSGSTALGALTWWGCSLIGSMPGHLTPPGQGTLARAGAGPSGRPGRTLIGSPTGRSGSVTMPGPGPVCPHPGSRGPGGPSLPVVVPAGMGGSTSGGLDGGEGDRDPSRHPTDRRPPPGHERAVSSRPERAGERVNSPEPRPAVSGTFRHRFLTTSRETGGDRRCAEGGGGLNEIGRVGTGPHYPVVENRAVV